MDLQILVFIADSESSQKALKMMQRREKFLGQKKVFLEKHIFTNFLILAPTIFLPFTSFFELFKSF
jgi:hypothetical protein